MPLALRKWIQILVAVFLTAMLLYISFIMVHSGRTIRRQVTESYESSMRLYAQMLEKDLRSVELSMSNFLIEDTNVLFRIEKDGDLLARQTLRTDLARNALFSGTVDGAFFFCANIDTQLCQYDIWPLTRTDALIEILEEDLFQGRAPSNTWYQRKIDDAWCLVRVLSFSSGFLGVYVRTDALVEDLQNSGMIAVDDYCILHEDGSVLTSGLAGGALDPNQATAWIDGECYIVLRAPILSTDLQLAALVRESTLTAPLRRNYWIAAVYAGTFLLLCICAYKGLNRSILRPVSMLTQTMRAFRDGDADARVRLQSPIRELNAMIDSFNEMAGEVVDLKIANYESELAKNRALLTFYQLQIRPHFLINSLNTIYSLAQVNNAALIQDMTMFLAEYYRYTMKTTGTFVRLADELEHVRNFLKIHIMRLEGRLDVFYEIDEAYLNIAIPPLLLQTFVENSVQYAVSMDDMTFIGIEVQPCGGEPDKVSIVISDTGLGFSQEWLADGTEGEGSEHIGIYNVRQRLRIAYGGQARLRVGNTQPHGARVDIVIPAIRYHDAKGEETP